MTSIAKTIFSGAFEIAPIWLVGGLVGYAPLNFPAINLSDPLNSGFFAHFKPLAGSTLAQWDIATYPMANFATAANAVVQKPLNVSMAMICPAQNNGGYLQKTAILTAMQFLIQNHISNGGTFTILTPAFVYANCLLTVIRDITPPSDKQVQYVYQWDFTQPLITTSQAQSVLGTLMNKVENGFKTTSTWGAPAP